MLFREVLVIPTYFFHLQTSKCGFVMYTSVIYCYKTQILCLIAVPGPYGFFLKTSKGFCLRREGEGSLAKSLVCMCPLTLQKSQFSYSEGGTNTNVLCLNFNDRGSRSTL